MSQTTADGLHARPSPRPSRGIARLLAGTALVGVGAVIGLGSVFGAFFTVHERERAVVTRYGAFHTVAAPGFHLKLPWIDGVESYDLAIRSLNMPKLETFTIDNQHVDVDLVVQYHVPADNVERVFRETRDYEQRLTTMAVDRMKIALGKRNIADLPEQRGAVAREVYDTVRAEAARLYGLEVSDVQIVNISYSQAFRAAVDASAVAKANVERSHQQQRQAEVDAQTARVRATGEANAAIEQARGGAESRLLQARAEAEAIRVRGEAEGQAIQAQTRALAETGPSYVSLEQARRWNGALPAQMLTGGPVPFLNLQAGMQAAR